jgi:poly-gamma-glutamate capsule biosynthesis protein CapA/YwtB (metallophosphatase superfamily)
VAAEVTLMFGGDVMTGRGIDQVFARPSAPQLFEPYVRDAREYVRLAERVNGPINATVAPHYIWGDALAEIARSRPDLRIVNLETSVTTSDTPWPGKGIHYRMHPDNVDCLAVAKLDVCTLANNHVLDWGRAGLSQTLEVLQRAGLHTAGAGDNAEAAEAPAALPLPEGGRVLVFARATASSGVPDDWAAQAARSGVALLPDLGEETARRLAGQVAAQRRPGDVVVVSIHWGANWVSAVPASHRRFAHRLVELGAADVIHGHSSHHPLPGEVHRGKLILYGCGDLINDYEGITTQAPYRSDVGCLYFATIARPGGGLRNLQITPMMLRRFQLVRADAEAQEWAQPWLHGSGARLEPLAEGPGWRWRWDEPAQR